MKTLSLLKPTKTERRILTEEVRRKQKPVSLDDFLKLKSLLKAARSGSKACQCGSRISANKPKCLTCSELPSAPPAVALAASA